MVGRAGLCVIVFMALMLQLNAQVAGFVNTLNQLQDARVKSLDEFVERFNAKEVPTFIRNSSAPQNRQTYIKALFDTSLYHNDNVTRISTIDDFVSAVVADSIFLNMHDTTCYAEAHCLFTYKGKDVDVNIVLQYENIRDNYYDWAIVGVNGLDKIGFFNSDRNGYISPIQHEFHFAELSRAFPHMIDYCKLSYDIDQLSYLIALVEEGILRYRTCIYHQYYFFSVPKYLFIVSHKNRAEANSGWLISEVLEVPMGEEKSVISSLLGRHY